MIQPIRSIHRHAFVALAAILPAILLFGLEARRPRQSRSAHTPEVPATAYEVRESSSLWHQHSIDSKFYSKSDRPQEMHVVLLPAQALNEPDLLLYWSTSEASGSALPVGANLLGPFAAGHPFPLPLNETRAGNLVLFSLAHQAVFDTAKVKRLP